MNGVTINQVHDVKFLGVYLDDHMSWNRHVNHVISQISSGICSMKVVQNFLPD